MIIRVVVGEIVVDVDEADGTVPDFNHKRALELLDKCSEKAKELLREAKP